jgi:predicted RNase H-like HicB family nuclease
VGRIRGVSKCGGRGVLTGKDGAWYNSTGIFFGKAFSAMHNEFTAVIEQDGAWFIAFCPEVPGANGQGTTREETLASLREAIKLILEDRREDGLRGVPANAEQTTVTIP